MQLRKYQSDTIQAVRYSFINHRRVLAVLPCGAGKTIMFAYMCVNHILKHSDGHVWFLVHRRELVEQTIDTFIRNDLSLDKVRIGMVQTIARHLDEYERPSMIIFDEAHHSAAGTWRKIIDHYPDVAMVGLTATPCRLDGQPLGDIYERMVIGPSADELIHAGWLAPYDYYAPSIHLEDAEWKERGSDYDMEDVTNRIDHPSIYGDILDHIDLSRKTIIYAPSIRFSEHMVEQINAHYGQTIASHVDGETPTMQRDSTIQDFRDGRIRILSNVDLIGEGFDVPDCDCCILLRPTKSVALYIQQATRCLRPAHGKRAVIYDFVGNIWRHGMPTDKREWSLEKRVRCKQRKDTEEVTIRECKNCYRVYRGNQAVCPYCGFNNGKTRQEIAIEEHARLEKIEQLERINLKREVAMTRTEAGLVELGRRRGYRNPVFWARKIIEARQKK